MNSNDSANADVIEIVSGQYYIGSDNIPNASPMHRRELHAFWIDRSVVSFGHLERFIAGGGYHDDSLWSDSTDHAPPTSIDQRCEQLYEQSVRAAELFRDKPTFSVDIPVVGVTWMEAAAIARYFGGRLPFESEWEVAMQRSATRVATSAATSKLGRCRQRPHTSDWGCTITTNLLQEWTADAFSPRHWRADSDRHGTFWTPAQTYGVSIRGSSQSDTHKDYRFRRAADPTEINSARGFRRVWEKSPTVNQFSSSFTTF